MELREKFNKRGDACNDAHDCLGSLVWDQQHPSCTQHIDVEVTRSFAGMASASAAAYLLRYSAMTFWPSESCAHDIGLSV